MRFCNYRWVGHFAEYSCPRCGHVLQRTQPPATSEEAHCTGCRLAVSVDAVTQSIAELVADRDEWKARALRAERRHDDLLDEIDAARRAS